MADGSRLNDETTVVNLMDNQMKMYEKLLIDQKSVLSTSGECVLMKKPSDEIQKMDKMSNEMCSTSSSVEMNEKCAIVSIVSDSVNKCAINGMVEKKNAIGQNGLRANATITSSAAATTELKPPTRNAKDIEDIRKKRRCADRYDSSESSDR